ncbi:protein SHQ1 homolog isoform X5 [Xiphias gladius]|uniref:protein SHQ1 homolog isoform X5 n=1 Tax=Xiphias gladius TaxID=8245 RepID=UPI001A987C7D|nr:protein SHQ1 homolog isoform X5 [Xiphias gladius]
MVCFTSIFIMITPAFDLSQDPEYLIFSIRVPYTRTSEFDLYIDGRDFKFYAKPYFLRLTLPGRIVEDGREKAKFDIDKGLFTLRMPKETAGEHFEGLQMLTSLLAPKGSRSAKPLVEDLSTGCSESIGDDEEEDEDFDWQVEQEVYMESSEEELRALQKYGFGNQRSGVFARLQEELSDVIDIKNPEGMAAAERRQGRLEAEASAFSPDHYLADLFEDDEIKGLLKFKPWWTKLSPSTEQEGEVGKACVLKCLLDIHKVFRENDPAYILNDLYVTDYCIWIQKVRSKKLTAFAALLQKASLQKKDLELELEELEEAATLVAEEEEEEEDDDEEQGASKNAAISRGDSSCSSSGSSDESEESEAEGQSCTESNKGGGGETSKDNPLQPQPTSTASPIPQEPTSAHFSAERKVGALPSASESTRQLIQEMGERMSEELRISPDSSYKGGRDCSQLSSAQAKNEAASGRSSSGTLLELSPRRNPLLIIQTQDNPDE